jgi:hypothetical protein
MYTADTPTPVRNAVSRDHADDDDEAGLGPAAAGAAAAAGGAADAADVAAAPAAPSAGSLMAGGDAKLRAARGTDARAMRALR